MAVKVTGALSGTTFAEAASASVGGRFDGKSPRFTTTSTLFGSVAVAEFTAMVVR